MKKQVDCITIELLMYEPIKSMVKSTLKEYDGNIEQKDILFAEATSDLVILDSIGIPACLSVYTYSVMEDVED